MPEPDDTPRNPKAARSPEELFPLIEFCRAGKLKEVGEWIAAGHPIDPPQTSRRNRRRSPLQIAIEKGFFALAEQLLDGGCDPMANGNALADAVAHRDVEIAKLLIDRGVPTDSIDAQSVFDGGPDIVKLFVAHGFDPTQELAYFHGLCYTVHPLLFLVKGYKDRFPELQQQAEMALCHYCQEGNLRAVSLLLWAGARPDVEVPDPDHPDDPDYCTSAMIEAVQRGQLDVLKRLKPQDYPECLKTLFDHAWGTSSQSLIDYLVGVGAVLNTKENGGSKFLEHLLWSLDSSARPLFGTRDPSKIDEEIRLIERVGKLGAKLIPGEDANPRHLRDHFRHLEPERVLRVFRVLKETGAATVELLDLILASPSFRKRLGDQSQAIDRLLHPPPPKPASPPKPDKETVPVTSQPLPSKHELESRAEAVLLDFVRQNPDLHFSKRTSSESIYAQTARRRLGLPKSAQTNLTPIFAEAARTLNKRVKSFSIEVDDDEWSRGAKQFCVRLEDDREWADAIRDAWDSGGSPNEHFLTDAAIRLLALIQSGELGSDFAEEHSVTERIALPARSDCLEKYLEEIAMKTGINLQWKKEGVRWGETRKFRIWIESEGNSLPEGCGLNPPLETDFARYTRSDIEATRARFHELILKAAPSGTNPVFLLRIQSHRDLRQCFPREFSIHEFLEFLRAVPFHSTLKLSYDFRSYAACWFVTLIPKSDWSASIAAIRDESSQPTLQERLGISADAAKVIAWIDTLRPEELLGSYTPIVEEHCERRIGIAAPWTHGNFAAYLQMLVEEINDKTDYDLRIQPWHEYSSTKLRIRIARKKTDVEDVLRRLHWIAWKRGVVLDFTSTEQAIERLLSGDHQK